MLLRSVVRMGFVGFHLNANERGCWVIWMSSALRVAYREYTVLIMIIIQS